MEEVYCKAGLAANEPAACTKRAARVVARWQDELVAVSVRPRSAVDYHDFRIHVELVSLLHQLPHASINAQSIRTVRVLTEKVVQ